MARKAAVGKKKTSDQASKSQFPAQITWSEEVVWALLAEVEKTENRKVLLGPQPGENTSGDTKNTVYARIGKVLFPELYDIDHVLLSSRVKGKFEALCNMYKKQKRRLLVTGGGLRDEDHQAAASEGNTSEFLKHYIPWGGPNADTPEAAKNLWDAITKDFPFFPALHRLLAERPSVSPIAITTGVGPAGRRTVHLQPLDRAPAVDVDDASAAQEVRSFGTDASNSPSTSPRVQRSSQAPRPSMHMSVDKGRLQEAFKPVSKKRGFDAMLFDALQESRAEVRRRSDQEALRAERDAIREERQQLLEEFKAGIWSREEYQEKVCELVGDSHKRPRLSEEIPARPRQREPSPQWDAETGPLPSEDEYS